MRKKGNAVEYSEMPNWPTSLRGVSRGNLLTGIDNSVWALRSVPMSPIADAKDSSKKLLGGKPLEEAFANLSHLAHNRMGRRSSSKSTYRQIQLLTVDMPRFFRAPIDHPLRQVFDDSFGQMVTKTRLCLLAVRLRDSLGSGGLQAAIDSVVNTVVFAEPAQLDDFTRDNEVVSNALDRAGLREPTTEEILLADAWWNRGDRSDTPFIPHTDHMHVFPTSDSLRVIEEGADRGDWSMRTCKDWPKDSGSHSITMAAMSGLDIEYGSDVEVTDPAGAWVSNLIESGAVAVSIRALIEPPKVTRGELRRNRKSYADDIRERQREGKMDKAEQEERLRSLSDMESAYSGSGSVPATLVDSSVVVAFDGKPTNTIELGAGSLAHVNTMDDRQLLAWSEMTLCSKQRSNPYLQDLPATAVAYSGVNGLSVVGDPRKMSAEEVTPEGEKTGHTITVPSILAGVTEFDRQQAWLSGTAASGVDKEPLALVAGTTGSGKAVPLDTWLPTPEGFIKMGDAQIGTRLLGRKGKPVTVSGLSPIQHDRRLFRMHLSDGQKTICDEEHQWIVVETNEYPLCDDLGLASDIRTLRRLSDETPSGESASADELIDVLRSTCRLNRPHWRNAAEVVTSLRMVGAATDEKGHYGKSAALGLLAQRLEQRYSGGTEEYRMTTGEIVASGLSFAIRAPAAVELPGLDEDCEDIYHEARGLIAQGKPLHQRWMRASIAQRLSCVQAVMDDFGWVEENLPPGLPENDRVGLYGGGVCFAELPAEIADGFIELVRSLGILAATRAGETVKVSFVTDMQVFTDPDRQAKLPTETPQRSRLNNIIRIEEVESQPVRCLSVDDPDAAYLLGGFIPTSNTQALLWWAWQGAQMGQPQVILDPKTGSDHSEAIKGRNTLIASLDELTKSDGIFDPLRFARTPQAGIDMATSLLSQVNPWGDNRDNFSTSLARALYIGVQSGARCIGRALEIASGEDRVHKQMIDDVFDLAQASPMFRACVGMNNDAKGIRVSDGITYIKVGDAHLELPSPGQSTFEMSSTERASLALVRMMIFGSSMALTGRNGVLHADEAWTFLSAGKSEIERLGRMARSQGVLPILYTQRVTDVTEQSLQNYISRGFILGIRDEAEAYAACDLFGLEPTPDRIGRITAGSTKGGTVGDGEGSGDKPNFESLRPLREGYGGKVIRGSVAIYSDLSGDRANTIEVKIPEWFFRRSSTNTVDQAMRRAAV